MINIHNIDDNECGKWCLVRYLYLADHNLKRITKADKDFELVLKLMINKGLRCPRKVNMLDVRTMKGK